MPLRDVIDAYCQAWNAEGESACRALLEKAWHDEGTYCDPRADLSGREALVAHIGRIRAARPGTRIVMTSGLDVHHGVLRFAWRLVDGAGTVLVEGIDFGELAADGRLRKIVGFFGPLPPA